MEKRKCCYHCAHRKRFICSGLKLIDEEGDGKIDLRKFVDGIEKEEDLIIYGEKCTCFDPKYWSVS